MISAKIINDIKIHKPIFKNKNKKPIKGYDLCRELFANIFIVAKKNSGKTNVIKRMVQEFTDKNTTVIAFSSTLYEDELWIQIQEYCEFHNINFIGHREIFENGVDQIKEFLNTLQAEEKTMKEKSKNVEKKKTNIIMCDDDDESQETNEKKKRSKYQTAKYILIFDDISDELKNKNLISLAKRNRHLNCKMIFSSQYILDIKPETKKQIDLWLLFKGLNQEKLEDTYNYMDTSIDFLTFEKLYNDATTEPYSFFYVDTRHNIFRQNFNIEYQVA